MHYSSLWRGDSKGPSLAFTSVIRACLQCSLIVRTTCLAILAGPLCGMALLFASSPMPAIMLCSLLVHIILMPERGMGATG